MDAEVLPYWNHGDLIGGQDERVKCTAYRKPHGGALLCVVNLTRESQQARLTVDWERLASSASASVVDALSGEPVALDGKSLTAKVRPLNFRLLHVP